VVWKSWTKAETILSHFAGLSFRTLFSRSCWKHVVPVERESEERSVFVREGSRAANEREGRTYPSESVVFCERERKEGDQRLEEERKKKKHRVESEP